MNGLFDSPILMVLFIVLYGLGIPFATISIQMVDVYKRQPGYGPILTDVTKWREQIKFPDLSTIDWKAAWERDGADPEEYEGKLV